MRWLSVFIIAGLIPVIVSGIVSLMKKEDENNAETGTVKLPDIILVIGLTGTLIFSAVAVCSAIFGSVFASVVFSLFAILSASLIVGSVNCRIRYGKDGFTYKPFIGKQKFYRYDELTAIKSTLTKTTLYAGKRRINIDGIAKGGREFIRFAKRERSSLTGGKLLPAKKEKDIFNGHIANPWLMTCIYGFSAVILTAVAVFFTVVGCGIATAEYVDYDAVFETCERGDKEILLRSADGIRYIITNVPNDYDISRISAVCDGRTKVTVSAEKTTPKVGDSYFYVYGMRTADGDVLPKEDFERFKRSDYMIMFIFAAFGAVFVGICVFAFVVGRNPEKFPRWVVRFYFGSSNVVCDVQP